MAINCRRNLLRANKSGSRRPRPPRLQNERCVAKPRARRRGNQFWKITILPTNAKVLKMAEEPAGPPSPLFPNMGVPLVVSSAAVDYPEKVALQRWRNAAMSSTAMNLLRSSPYEYWSKDRRPRPATRHSGKEVGRPRQPLRFCGDHRCRSRGAADMVGGLAGFHYALSRGPSGGEHRRRRAGDRGHSVGGAGGHLLLLAALWVVQRRGFE